MTPFGDLTHSYERSKLCGAQSAIAAVRPGVPGLIQLKLQEPPNTICALSHLMAKALESNVASVTTSRAQLRQIGFLPLLALFYGYTAGGPFGYEEIFQGSGPGMSLDRKSTRLNSSHRCISYAV